MDSTQFWDSVSQWAQSIGVKNARNRLIAAKICPHTASQISRGVYSRSPRDLTYEAIKKEMAKDGFLLKSDGQLRAG